MAVKRRAAKSLAEAQDKLVRTLSKQDWPAQIEKEVASLVKQLNRSYPIAQTICVTKDAEDFYNLAVDLYKEGGDLAAAARALEVKLGS
jgi:ribosomal protein L2